MGYKQHRGRRLKLCSRTSGRARPLLAGNQESLPGEEACELSFDGRMGCQRGVEWIVRSQESIAGAVVQGS